MGLELSLEYARRCLKALGGAHLSRPEYESDAAFHRALRRQAYGIAFRRTGDARLSEDIADDAVVRACAAIDNVKDFRTFRAWFAQITANLITDASREKKPVSYDAFEPPLPEQVLGKLAVEHEADSRMSVIGSSLEEAWRQLDPKSQALFQLCFVEGLSLAEVASQLEISVGAVKSRTFRMRQQLLERFQALERRPSDYGDERRLALIREVLLPDFEKVEGQLRVSLKNVSLGEIAKAVEARPSLRKRYGIDLKRGVGQDLLRLGFQVLSRNAALRRTYQAKTKNDPAFQAHLESMREKAKQALQEPDKRARAAEAGRQTALRRAERYHERRRTLRDQVLVPMGASTQTGDYDPKRPLRTGKVVEAVKAIPSLRAQYKSGLHMGVLHDLNELGQARVSRAESIALTLKERNGGHARHLR